MLCLIKSVYGNCVRDREPLLVGVVIDIDMRTSQVK